MAVRRVFFNRVLEGDAKKTWAQSNVAGTGGGARDLRVPADPFLPILKTFFPKTLPDGLQEGTLHFHDKAGKPAQVTAKFHSQPTEARPTEVRIGEIHKIPPWIVNQTRYRPEDGDWYFFLAEDDNGRVWASLQENRIDDLYGPLRDAIRSGAAARPPTRGFRGYLDFTTDAKVIP